MRRPRTCMYTYHMYNFVSRVVSYRSIEHESDCWNVFLFWGTFVTLVLALTLDMNFGIGIGIGIGVDIDIDSCREYQRGIDQKSSPRVPRCFFALFISYLRLPDYSCTVLSFPWSSNPWGILGKYMRQHKRCIHEKCNVMTPLYYYNVWFYSSP